MPEDTAAATVTPVEPESPAALKQEALPKKDPTRVLAESTMSKLSYETLLLRGNLEQTWKINKYVAVEGRSISGGVAEFVSRHLAKQHGQDWARLFDAVSTFHWVAACYQKFNGEKIGDDLDAALLKGYDEATKVFEAKLAWVRGKPETLITLLYQHYLLFVDRIDDFVRSAGEVELGNS